jgi:predicted GIY-YIG superfamily endonuclease
LFDIAVGTVLLVRCDGQPEAFYTGISDDLKVRLSAHNSGVVTHTAKHRPWRVKTYVPFTDELRVVAFEK